MAAPTKPMKPNTDELSQRRATGQAVGGNFVQLLAPDDNILLTRGRDYRLYRETLRDDQCASTFGDRRLAVTSKEWQVDAGGEAPIDQAAADDLREQIAALEWDRITDRMLYARWYGHGIAEALWRTDGSRIILDDIRVRDRSRFAYSNDGGIWLLSDAGQWVRMPERKFWHIAVGADHDDDPYGLGLAHYAYWPVFFKRNDLKFWLIFAEKFGSPTAVGKIPMGKWDDAELKDAVLEQLLCFSSEAAIVVPEEAQVELLEAARTGAGTYDELYDRMDGAIAKLIIGQTASTEGTPGKLGGEGLRSEVRDDLIKADADLVCGSFNRQIATWLTEWNFPGAKIPRVWRKVEPEEDMATAAATDAAVKALGFTPSEEYIQERYGKHWTKTQPLDLGGGNPFGGPRDPNDPAADFAERGAIATLRAAKAVDQDAIKDAAAFLADRYATTLGPRVDELLGYAEESGDFDTFRKRLLEMMATPPPMPAVESVRNASFFSRLLGMLKSQR